MQKTTLRHGCSPVNSLHIFRIPFPKNNSGELLLAIGSEHQYCGSVVCKTPICADYLTVVGSMDLISQFFQGTFCK